MAGVGTDPSRKALLDRIEVVLDADVRPGLRDEGGDVELVGVDDDAIVQVRLLGSCASCSGVSFGQLQAIESSLKARIPEIRFLEPVL